MSSSNSSSSSSSNSSSSNPSSSDSGSVYLPPEFGPIPIEPQPPEWYPPIIPPYPTPPGYPYPPGGSPPGGGNPGEPPPPGGNPLPPKIIFFPNYAPCGTVCLPSSGSSGSSGGGGIPPETITVPCCPVPVKKRLFVRLSWTGVLPGGPDCPDQFGYIEATEITAGNYVWLGDLQAFSVSLKCLTPSSLWQFTITNGCEGTPSTTLSAASCSPFSWVSDPFVPGNTCCPGTMKVVITE
jgi:hypothetical protein